MNDVLQSAGLRGRRGRRGEWERMAENVNIGGSKFTPQFPGHSFTVIRMERK
jgi:hypothetical protein